MNHNTLITWTANTCEYMMLSESRPLKDDTEKKRKHGWKMLLFKDRAKNEKKLGQAWVMSLHAIG